MKTNDIKIILKTLSKNDRELIMKEICIGDKVMWKENGKWSTITLDPDAWIYYTLAPKGFIEIKALT